MTRRSRWRARFAALLPRRSRWKVRSRALGPRWRPFVDDAVAAERRYHAAVRRLDKGPLRERLETVGRDVATAVDQTWQVASAGQDLTDAKDAIDVGEILGALERSEGAAADVRRRQLEVAKQVDQRLVATETRLRELDARLDEAVTRALALGATQQTDALAGIGSAVTEVVAELTNLSAGLAELPALPPAPGTTALAEAFNLANNTPNMLYDLVLGGILAATLVPVVVEHMDHDDQDGIDALATVITVVLGAMTVLAMLAAPWIIRAYSITTDPADAERQAEVAVPLLVMFLPQMFFYGLTTLGTALLNARRSFAVPAFAPVLNNVVVICLFLALPRFAGGDQPTFDQVRDDTGLLLLLGLGTTAGIVAMTLVLWPAMRHAGIRLRWRFELRNPAVRQVVRLSAWTLGYVLANQVAFFTVIVLANGVDGVTAYTVAYMFFQLPYGLWAVSVMVAFTPEMAGAAVRGEMAALRARFTYGLRLVLVLLLPAAAGLTLLAGPVVTVALERGALDAESGDTIAGTLAAFSAGLPFFAAYLYAMRGFYALRDTRTPFWINLGENALNVVLAIAFVGPFGVEGLAASFSVAYAVFAVVALVVLQRRIGPWFDRRTAIGIARLVGATAALVVVVVATQLVLGDGVVAAVVAGALGTLAYGLVLWILRAEELQAVTNRLRGRRLTPADDTAPPPPQR